MEELDLLKKAWKKNNQSFQQVTENEIYKMIHRKSSSIVKWILIISILEFVLWNAVNLIFFGDNYIEKHFQKDIIAYVTEMDTIYNFISCAVVALFIYLFYKNYKNISATSSTKQLMRDILKTRKTVIYYVWFNIILFVVGTLSVFFIQMNFSAEIEKKISSENGSWIILRALGIILIFVLIIWLFYRLIYGILLNKLNRNYKELQKMDLE